LTVEKLRRPLFAIAYLALLVAVSLEGASWWLGKGDRIITHSVVADVVASYHGDAPSEADVRRDMQRAQRANGAAPGYGIPHLALLDGIILLAMTWMLLPLILPKRIEAIQGRVQGVITLVVAIAVLSSAVVLALGTFTKLIVMISLVSGGPFGFAAYMAIWGFFEVSTARAILGSALFLKIGFTVLLILAHQQFLKVKSMLLIIATSVALTIVTQFLIGLVPRPMASITDAVAGIVNAIAAAIWAVILAVMSLISVLRAIRVDRGLASSEGAS
jgi:hypothetical protein